MNTIAASPSRAQFARSGFGLSELFRREPYFAAIASLMVIAMAPTLFAMAVDPRQFQGIDIWEKPLKFQVALAVYLGTLALFAGWLPKGMTGRLTYRIFSGVVCAAVIAEMVWIGGAAANGIGSHFNVADPVMGALYGLMGVLAVTLTSASLVYGIAFLRDRNSALDPGVPPVAGAGSGAHIRHDPRHGRLHEFGGGPLGGRQCIRRGGNCPHGLGARWRRFARGALLLDPCAAFHSGGRFRCGIDAQAGCGQSDGVDRKYRLRRLHGLHFPAGDCGPAISFFPLNAALTIR